MARNSQFPLSQSAILMICLAVFAGVALYGFRDAVLNIEENKCEMTYMFQWPEYNKVPMFKGTSKLFPRYALYLYGEGAYSEMSRNLKLNGIPVLFIPGNAGSYKQVRSLASVALRKAEDSRHEFNYFTVDLDESFSGIFGGFLDDETEFVRLCVTRILRLYKGRRNPPKSVVLIGHSMGGIIARALFTLPKFDPKMVHTIITLGTPHSHPVIALDPFLGIFYNNVNRKWKREAYNISKNAPLRNITVVSIGGGFRDLLVRSSLTALENWLPQSHGISAVTTSVPRVWASVDHLCLCWCKQLVLVTNRALFDMIDPSTQQITLSRETRMRVLHHHFVQNPGTKNLHHKMSPDNSIAGMKTLSPVMVHRRLWVFKSRGKDSKGSSKLFTFPVEDWRVTHNALLILTNLEAENWIFACNAISGHPCGNATDLSRYAQLLPANDSTLKFMHLRLPDFPSISHFSLIVPPSKTSTLLWTQFHSNPASSYAFDVPWLFSRSPATLHIEADVIFANITLPSVSKAWKVYKIQVDAEDCEDSSLLIGRVNVPWFNENVYVSSKSGSLQLAIKLHHPRPRGFGKNIEVHLWVDPKCAHTVRIKPDLNEMLGQIYRFYGVQLLSWMYSLQLLVLAWQISSIVNVISCPSFFDLISNVSRSFRVLLLLTQVHFVISQVILPFFVMQDNTGQHDWLPGIADLRTFDWLLPLVLITFTAVFLTVVAFVWTGILLKIGGRLVFWRQDIQDLLAQTRLFPMKHIVLSVLTISVSIFVCGTLGLLIAFFFFLGRSCKQTSVLRQLENTPKESRNIKLIALLKGITNFSHTVCTLSLFTLGIALPSLVVWIRGLQHSYRLKPDPSSVLGAWMGFSLIHLGYHPLGHASQSLVYVSFLIGVLITQAPLFPLYMLPYSACLILTSLNASRIAMLWKAQDTKAKSS